MSRKKNRTAGTATTVMPAAPPREAPARPAATPQTPSGVQRLIVRIARLFGSLHMAIILLSTAVVVLFLGSWLESKFDARISQEFVYRTWWFTALLFLFAINIFCAAAKKWPWKKHQTGFLITHVGLLTMLAGGILNSLAGVDAMMRLLDTPYMEYQRKFGIAQQSNEIVYPDQGTVTVERVRQRWKVARVADVREDRKQDFRDRYAPDGQEMVIGVQRYPFTPGVAPWGDADFVREGPLLVRFLDTLAHPLPRSWQQKLTDGADLRVAAFYPHAVRDAYAAAAGGQGFPAVKILLSSERLNPLDGDWLALDAGHLASGFQDLGPARMELTSVIADELIPDFLDPPAADKLGPSGKLVLFVAGTRFVLDVAEVQRQTSAGGPWPLGDTKWAIHSLTYQPAARLDSEGDADHKPRDPCIECMLLSPQGTSHNYRIFARVQAKPALIKRPQDPAPPAPAPTFLYHPPDFLFGAPEQSLKGLLQLAQSASGKLYYRVFVHRGGRFTRDAAGEVQLNQDYDVWPFMKGQFRIVRHHPSAEWQETYAPRHARLGLKRGGLFTVFRCALDGMDCRGDRPEFPDHVPDMPARLRRRLYGSESHGSQGALPRSRELYVAAGTQEQQGQAEATYRWETMSEGDTCREEFYRITYAQQTERLGFDVKLLRAESQIDPGTDRPATYSSFVLVNDPPAGGGNAPPGPNTNRFLAWLSGDSPPDQAVRREAMITMNQPLDYRGYKLYQSGFEPITDERGRPVDDESGRPLHYSALTVGRDPGLWLKYIGSSMLALGISCMFYMRAYFFKPRARKPGIRSQESGVNSQKDPIPDS